MYMSTNRHLCLIWHSRAIVRKDFLFEEVCWVTGNEIYPFDMHT